MQHPQAFEPSHQDFPIGFDPNNGTGHFGDGPVDYDLLMQSISGLSGDFHQVSTLVLRLGPAPPLTSHQETSH
jgi:hypothetical protein